MDLPDDVTIHGVCPYLEMQSVAHLVQVLPGLSPEQRARMRHEAFRSLVTARLKDTFPASTINEYVRRVIQLDLRAHRSPSGDFVSPLERAYRFVASGFVLPPHVHEMLRTGSPTTNRAVLCYDIQCLFPLVI